MVAGTPLLEQFPGLERLTSNNNATAPGAAVALSTSAGTQIILIPWTAPANANGWLEKLVISNQSGSPATVNFWDADLVSSGTVPPARGSNSNPLIPTINIAAGAQVFLGYDLCPNVDLQAGLVGQASQASVQVWAQVVIQVG